MNAGHTDAEGYHPGVESLCWPRLDAPFDQALRLAVTEILANYAPVGVIAAGSIFRGQGGPTSDIDLYVIHAAPFRQRLQRRYAGVPCEVFINPPGQIRRYFEDEYASNRPITAHMLATGLVVLDLDPIVQTLRSEAANWLATPPNPTEDSLRWRRYMIVDLLDNAHDLVDSDIDDEMARMILSDALRQMIDYRFLVANRHLPRLKATLAELSVLDPVAAGQARAILGAQDAGAALALAKTLAHALIGDSGFFEWDSAQEIVLSSSCVN